MGSKRDAQPFQLTRYFMATSLVAFAVLAAALLLLELGEQRLFAQAQRDQGAFFALAQGELLREQKDAGRSNLVAVHEGGHIALAHVFANALWDSHFAPLVARAQAVPVDRCRRPAGVAPAASPAPAAQCLAELRAQVSALPGFAALDAPVRALMRRTTVFKIKVYDLRGLTVYSSELAQVGEDKADNLGWRAAAAGRPASELVHRNRFSAFEGVVEDRDLIQSYIPVEAPGGGVAGVFEIYSDVTPLLRHLDAAAERQAAATARNQARVQQAADRNQRGMEVASAWLLLTVAVLLLLFYLAMLYLVRNAQRLIDAEARAREQAVLREQAWHRDKVATMGAMAANISHEVGNPLAIISGLAQEIGHWRAPADFSPEMPRMIVEQTARIAAMTRRISDFATAGRETPEALDVNEQVRAVCDFLSFDRRFRGTPVSLRLAQRLPACTAIRDHLIEVLMELLQGLKEAAASSGEAAQAGRRIEVETAASERQVLLRIGFVGEPGHASCALPPHDARIEAARQRVEAMGGHIVPTPAGLEIQLPAAA